MAALISHIQLPTGIFFAEVSRHQTDAALAQWVRDLSEALVYNSPELNPFAARLIREAEEFRAKDRERKKVKPSKESTGIRGTQRNPPESVESSLHTVIHTDRQTSKKGERDRRPPSNLKFKEPTRDEVVAYCKQRNNTIDATTFLAYYAGIGWEIKGQPVKDWKALIVLWEKRKR